MIVLLLKLLMYSIIVPLHSSQKPERALQLDLLIRNGQDRYK